MDKKIIIIVSVLVLLVFFDYKVRPMIYHHNAIDTVETIIDHWKKNQLTDAMEYWKIQPDSPPFYEVTGHLILNDTFGKKDGSFVCEVLVSLEFTPNNPVPSGKNWLFSLKKTRIGWQVIDFRMVE